MPSSSLHDLVAGAMVALATEAAEKVPEIRLTRKQQEELAEQLTGLISYAIVLYMLGVKVGLGRADEIHRYGG